MASRSYQVCSVNKSHIDIKTVIKRTKLIAGISETAGSNDMGVELADADSTAPAVITAVTCTPVTDARTRETALHVSDAT